MGQRKSLGLMIGIPLGLFIGISLGLFGVLVLGGCGETALLPPPPSPTNTSAAAATVRLTFAGSTTVQPLAQKIGDAYQRYHPNVELEIGAGGSRVGIEAAQNGTADIGMSSRDLKEEEKVAGITVHKIAMDVLAVIVHPSNPVDQLSHQQLKAIYTGTITNWSQLGVGEGFHHPIEVVVREITSGTRGAFDDIALEGAKPIDTAITQVTAGEVHTYVAEHPYAIGYVGFGHLGGSDVKVLAIDGVIPSPQAAIDGSYKLKRPLLLLTGPLSNPQAHSFIEFALSPEGQRIVREDGWVPVQ